MKWNNFVVTIVSVLVFQCYVNGGNENPVVTINTGKVKGTVLVSTEGKNFNAFRGIPYAKPPVKELRFKPPQPAEPWDGILDAKEDGAMCPQKSIVTNVFEGDENCLFLNVYTPENYVGKRYPVLFFIHGGGFVEGSGGFNFVGPQKYMNMQDVVIVTINYRLGVLGFVSTGDENGPGNYGMLDQVFSLKWAQENIAKFGGDPSKVTIFGSSAGGSSVAHLVLSPLTKGLFHAAIAQSGTTIGSWCFQRKPLYWATKIAEKINCPTSNTKEMTDCFKVAPVEQLVDSTASFNIAPLFPLYLSPVKELPGVGGGFLTEDPMVLLKEGRIGNKVPYITGICRNEGDLFANLIKRAIKTKGQEFLDNEFPSLYLPYLVPQVDNGMMEIAKEVQKVYYKDKDLNDENEFHDVLTRFFEDAMFAVAAQVTLNLMAEAGVPTYAYMYNHNSEYVSSIMSLAYSKSECKDKIQHGSEDFIQFQLSLAPGIGISEESEDDCSVAKIINTLWKNFANTKNPSFKGTPFENQALEWLPYNPNKPRYLQINLNPTMKEGLFTNKIKFWTEFIPSFAKKTKEEL